MSTARAAMQNPNGGHKGGAKRAARSAPPRSEHAIMAIRVVDAPRHAVFDAWTEPKRLPHWWGPRGFTLTTGQIEVSPGGQWEFVMHGPDGADVHNRIVFLTVGNPERLVLDHVSGPRFQMAVTFSARGERTRLTVEMLFPSAAERDKAVRKFGAVEGLSQTLDRLEEHLAGWHES